MLTTFKNYFSVYEYKVHIIKNGQDTLLEPNRTDAELGNELRKSTLHMLGFAPSLNTDILG